jgi:hypothetical protein
MKKASIEMVNIKKFVVEWHKDNNNNNKHPKQVLKSYLKQ